MGNTTDAPERVFVSVAATPTARLLEWLDDEAGGPGPRLVRLPLLVRRYGVGYSLRGARIGSAPDALEVDVDDSALGIGLGDRAASVCGRDRDACALLVEGYWRGIREGRHRLDVVSVVGPVDPAVGGATRIAIELPLPTSAEERPALGRMTSLAPGQNVMVRVYDVAAAPAEVVAFYRDRLRGAAQDTSGPTVTFSTDGGSLRIEPVGTGTRIQLVFRGQ